MTTILLVTIKWQSTYSMPFSDIRKVFRCCKNAIQVNFKLTVGSNSNCSTLTSVGDQFECLMGVLVSVACVVACMVVRTRVHACVRAAYMYLH